MILLVSKRGFKYCPGFLNSTGRLGPKRGRKCYVTRAFSGVATERGAKSEVKIGRRGGRQTGSTAVAVGSSLPEGRRACHLAGTRIPPSSDLASAAA